MMSHRFFFVLVLLCVFGHAVSKHPYNDFITHYRCKLGVVVSFPPKTVNISKRPKKSTDHYFIFSNPNSAKGPRPIFIGGPIVTIDNHCSIIMEDIRDACQPHPELEMPIDENTLVQHKTWFEGIMLNNCNLPWMQIERMKEILNDSSLMKQIFNARNQYVKKETSKPLLQRTNSDCVFIVKIPNMEKVSCRKKVLNNVKNNFSECYGVDFYRVDRYKPISMLVFIDTNSVKTINDYVNDISHYVRFDSDFKFLPLN